MTKTKIIKKRNRALNIAVIIIDTVVFVRVLFHFAMTMTGNWDDVSVPTIMVLVSLAMVALFLALVNNMRYRGHSSYVLASVVVLGLAALLFIYVLLSVSFAGLSAA